MSSWDFNSWDIEDSYTYKTSKKIKKFLEQKTVNDTKRNAQIKQTLRDIERALNTSPPKANDSPQSQPHNATNNASDQGKYSYNYQYKYKDNEPIVTPPPKARSTKTASKKPTQAVTDDGQANKSSKAPYIISGICLVPLVIGVLIHNYVLTIASGVIILSASCFKLVKVITNKNVSAKVAKKPKSTGDEKVDKLIENGNNFINQMHEVNAKIENPRLSEQIETLESLCTKIFAFIEKFPQKAPHIRRFMNYYVPITLKLLNCYDMLEEQEIDGENITSTMKSIEDNMQTIVTAFQNQLDMLFEDEAMDVSTDISVLKGMLEQEGLLNSKFKDKKKEEC